MPTYQFKNIKTNDEHTDFMSISERDIYLENNPDIEQMICSPAYVDPYSLGLQKAPKDFQQLIKKIHRQNPGSNIQTGNLGEV